MQHTRKGKDKNDWNGTVKYEKGAKETVGMEKTKGMEG